ncbi:Hypothetical predicted protein, partial [Olea europaea subsp. europaea]
VLTNLMGALNRASRETTNPSASQEASQSLISFAGRLSDVDRQPTDSSPSSTNGALTGIDRPIRRWVDRHASLLILTFT